MKRIFLATVAALVVIVSASAQRLADVRVEATIITDKSHSINRPTYSLCSSSVSLFPA